MIWSRCQHTFNSLSANARRIRIERVVGSAGGLRRFQRIWIIFLRILVDEVLHFASEQAVAILTKSEDYHAALRETYIRLNVSWTASALIGRGTNPTVQI